MKYLNRRLESDLGGLYETLGVTSVSLLGSSCMSGLTLTVLNDIYTIHRLGHSSSIPLNVLEAGFYAITKTDEELSIVCPASIAIEGSKKDSGWSCLKVAGPLDSSLTGILAKISNALAQAKISIFAISTYNTDYILVKSENVESAKNVLVSAGYNFL